MEKFKEIIVGEGLGEIKFGWTPEKTISVLGEPTEKERVSYPISEDEELFSESWHYDEYEISISFDEDFDGTWKLGTMAVSSEDSVMKGNKLVGLSRDEAVEIIKGFDLGEFSEEDLSDQDAPGIKLVSFEDKSINFWFDNGKLTEIQWGPLFEDEDTPIWPENN